MECPLARQQHANCPDRLEGNKGDSFSQASEKCGFLVVICTAVERWEQKETSTPCGTWNAETHSDYRDGLTAQLSRRGRCAADARSAAVGGCAAWQADVVGVQLQISHGWDVRPHPPGLCLEANHTRLGYQAGKIDRIHKRRVRSLEGISVTPRATEDQAIKFLADESYPTEELKAKVTTKVCAFTSLYRLRCGLQPVIRTSHSPGKSNHPCFPQVCQANPGFYRCRTDAYQTNSRGIL